MTKHKFTDEEVIDSLHYHQSGALARCCQCAYLNCHENCSDRLAKDALDLINRQKEEIANLTNAVDNSTKEFLKLHDEYQEQKAEIERLTVVLDAMRGAANSFKIHYNNAKAEAIKEFAERLKNYAEVVTTLSDDETILAIQDHFVDEVTEEMIGEQA